MTAGGTDPMENLPALLRSAVLAIAPRLLLDLLCAALVVHGVYLRRHPRRDYAFTYWLLNLVTFAVAAALSGVRVEIGLSLGLFGVFGILRYRTEAMRIRDLTYLFVMIGLAILHGVASNLEALARVAVIDVVLLGAMAWLELRPGPNRADSVTVRYDRLELLDPARRTELLDDLSRRVGVRCAHAHVQSVDLMHDSAELVVTFQPSEDR
jgi:hypothetical protein